MLYEVITELHVRAGNRVRVRELLVDALDEHADAERNDERFGLLLHDEKPVDEADRRAAKHRNDYRVV